MNLYDNTAAKQTTPRTWKSLQAYNVGLLAKLESIIHIYLDHSYYV